MAWSYSPFGEIRECPLSIAPQGSNGFAILDSDTAGEMIVEPPTSASPRRTGSLAVLGAGEAASAALVTPDALGILFAELGQSGFTCVIFNGPPFVGYPESRSWARHADAVIVVSRPDHLHPSDAIELRNQLDLVDTPVLGHVVLDGD